MGSCGWKHWVILGLFWRTGLFLCKNKGNESSRAGEGEMVPCLLPPRCTPHPSVIGPGPRSCCDTAGGALGAKPGRSSPRLGLGAWGTAPTPRSGPRGGGLGVRLPLGSAHPDLVGWELRLPAASRGRSPRGWGLEPEGRRARSCRRCAGCRSPLIN